MQLKQLKLSGFKSFVDPTVVPFSSQLVAVVGPNGCGKSNIIDAVRWVMGEGSAKTLRGESMADVIFSGSSQRKSIGQASVELIFDNNVGRFSGQYASYQEISIKRLVTRDGESSYFLNGGRCRRRDITDLFLGTGAGTRGYSIIGQNTISQLVEAKPEELRAYFEEAAGVSKYKERRRETLQRIAQTRENLARVSDICRELESQLQRLERQASAASKYKSLKQDERECRGDILVLKWQSLTQEHEQKRVELAQLLLNYEEHQAALANATNRQVQLENQRVESQNVFQAIQTQFYQMGNEVRRLHDLQQLQMREKQQLALDTTQVETDIQLAQSQLQQDTESHRIAQDECRQLLQHIAALKIAFEQSTQLLNDKQQQESIWNTKKQTTQSLLSQYQREVQVNTLKLQHIEQRRQDALVRLEKTNMERSLCAVDGDDKTLIVLQANQASAQDAYQLACDQLQCSAQHGDALKEQIRAVELQLRAEQDKAQSLKSEHAALQASLQAALSVLKPQSEGLDLFAEHTRLVELIHVDEKWRSACEWVLGESLQAITLESLEALMMSLESLGGRQAAFVTPTETVNEASAYPRLSDKINGFKPAWIYPLDNILTADSLAIANEWLPKLANHQSVITSDGFWLGAGWVRVADFAEQDETSLLLRKKAVAELHDVLTSALERVSLLQQDRDRLHDLFTLNDREHQLFIKARDGCQQTLQDMKTLFHKKQHVVEQASLRMNQLQASFDELHTLLEDLATDRIYADDILSSAVRQSKEYEQQWQQLLIEKSEWDGALAASRAEADAARAALHQAQLQGNKEQLKIQQLCETILREQTRLDTLNIRLLALKERLRQIDLPDNASNLLLLQTTEQHQRLEGELNSARQQLDELQTQTREIHQSKSAIEQHASIAQERIIQLQLVEQSLLARRDVLVESLAELELDASSRLAQLPSASTVDSREQQMLVITEKIKRLGAVNLVAIDEYQTELARKTHLDEQSRDLNEAMATLESAIAKMDMETQSRLKETFEQVNTLFQALFPRLFGGGHARLQLTCDNLLEAGVVVMAQPPGKRNSSIHSLSGGEKAMTAVALVFAIFQLNPSPFCMLDEVDAPLDDLNVGRFCDLVKEMSQYVQFLLITHNKVTMELADHLIGVTMREPGVSRIVAVDVEKALSFAE